MDSNASLEINLKEISITREVDSAYITKFFAPVMYDLINSSNG